MIYLLVLFFLPLAASVSQEPLRVLVEEELKYSPSFFSRSYHVVVGQLDEVATAEAAEALKERAKELITGYNYSVVFTRVKEEIDHQPQYVTFCTLHNGKRSLVAHSASSTVEADEEMLSYRQAVIAALEQLDESPFKRL